MLLHSSDHDGDRVKWVCWSAADALKRSGTEVQLVTTTLYVFSHAVGTRTDLSRGWNKRLSVQSLFVRVFGGHRVSFRLYMTVSGSTRRITFLYFTMSATEQALKSLYDVGEKERRKVLGDAHVEKCKWMIGASIGWLAITRRPSVDRRKQLCSSRTGAGHSNWLVSNVAPVVVIDNGIYLLRKGSNLEPARIVTPAEVSGVDLYPFCSR